MPGHTGAHGGNKQDKGNKPNIDKVIIFAGGGERNGITKEEAHQIWKIYLMKYHLQFKLMVRQKI